MKKAFKMIKNKKNSPIATLCFQRVCLHSVQDYSNLITQYFARIVSDSFQLSRKQSINIFKLMDVVCVYFAPNFITEHNFSEVRVISTDDKKYGLTKDF